MCNVLNPEHLMSSARLATPVQSSDNDVRGLADIAPWSQKNITPRNAVKLNLLFTKRNICIYKRNGE
jgi:hypothetical protein